MARGSITQRRDSYRVRVDYYDLNGHRHQVSKTAPSFRQAQLLVTQLQAEVDKSEFFKPSKITTEAFLNQWLDGYVKSTVSGKTLELYSYLSRIHLVPTWVTFHWQSYDLNISKLCILINSKKDYRRGPSN